MEPLNITTEFKKSLQTQDNPVKEETKEFGLQRQEFVNRMLKSNEWVEVYGHFFNRKEWDAS